MSVIVTATSTAILIGSSLQLVPTDATTIPVRPVRTQGLVFEAKCNASGTVAEVEREETAPCTVLPVMVTNLARERSGSLANQTTSLAALVHKHAQAFGVSVRELVLRGDWCEEGDAEHFSGVVLDIFAIGETDARFDFWEAVSEALDGRVGSDGVELSVMVHAC